MRSLQVAVLGCVCSSFALAAYPATYPFDNEDVPVPALPAAVPSYTFDDRDPGGYIYGSYLCNLDDHDFDVRGYSWCNECSTCMAHLKIGYKLPPVVPHENWNCSATGNIMSSDMFYAIAGLVDWTDCAGPECCSEYVGLPTFARDEVTAHQTWGDTHSIGVCKSLMPAPLYCGEIGWDWVCMERITGPTERSHVAACHDITLVFLRTCPTYLNNQGVNNLNERYETTTYLSTLSWDESFLVYGIHHYADKVCHPYSYYYASQDTEAQDASSAKAIQFFVGATAFIVV